MAHRALPSVVTRRSIRRLVPLCALLVAAAAGAAPTLSAQQGLIVTLSGST